MKILLVAGWLLALAALPSDLRSTEQTAAEQSFRRAAIAFFSQAERAPGGLRDLLAALPPAAELADLRASLTATPLALPGPAPASRVDGELLLFLLDALLDHEGRSFSDFQALRARCEQVLKGAPPSRDFSLAMFESRLGSVGPYRPDPAEVSKRFERFMERARAARESAAAPLGESVEVPDLVSELGDERAELLLRFALTTRSGLAPPSDSPTYAALQRLAFEMLEQLPVPQWYLAARGTPPPGLFEGLRRRFGVPAADDRGRGSYLEASRRWLTDCARAGRFADIRTALQRPAGAAFERFVFNREEADAIFLPELIHPRAEAAIRREHFELLCDLVRDGRSGETAWRLLAELAGRVGQDEQLIAFAKVESARQDAPHFHRESARATWAAVARELGREEEVKTANVPVPSPARRDPQGITPLHELARREAWPELLAKAREQGLWPLPEATEIGPDKAHFERYIHPILLVARALLKTDQTEEARRICTHYLLRHPEEIEAASILLETRSEKTDAVLRGLHERFRSNAGPSLWLALRSVEKGEWSNASKFAAESLAADATGRTFFWLPDHARQSLATVFGATGQTKEADEMRRQASFHERTPQFETLSREQTGRLIARPWTIEGAFELTHFLLCWDRVNEAETHLRETFRQLPSAVAFCEPENSTPYDLQYLSDFEKEIARSVFNEMERDGPPSAGLVYLRSRLEWQNRPESERLLQRALHLEPRFIHGWWTLTGSPDPATRAWAWQAIAERPTGFTTMSALWEARRPLRNLWLEAVSRSEFLRRVGVEPALTDGRDLLAANALLKVTYLREFEKIVIAAGKLRAPPR